MSLAATLFRTTSSLSRRCIARSSLATFSSSTGDVNDSSSDFCTGKVKFYRKDKKYGYILPDDKSMGEVFVHRYSILSDDDSNINRPFLYKGDLVRFTTVVEEGKNSLHAKNVTLANGARVPKYRTDPKEALKAVNANVRKALGIRVHDILTSEDISSKSPDTILKEIQEAYDAGKNQIEKAKKEGKIDRMREKFQW